MWSVILLQKLHTWVNVSWLPRSVPKWLTCWMVLCSVPIPRDSTLPCPAAPSLCTHALVTHAWVGKALANRVHGHSCRAGYCMSDPHGRVSVYARDFTPVCVQMLVSWLCPMNTHDHWRGRRCAADKGALSGPGPMLTWPGPGLRPAAWLAGP